MEDTMEYYGVLYDVVYGAPIDGTFDGKNFPDGLKDGDEVIVCWSGDAKFEGPYSVPNIWAGEGAQFRAPVNHPIYAAVPDDAGIIWGDEIKVEGQPAWLGDDEIVHVQWFGNHWYPNCPIAVKHATHTPLTAIRLPADHWAYAPLAKGFTPWPGGDWPPVDAGEVMFRNGGINPESPLYRWEHASPDNTFAEGCDIIGYKPKTPAAWQTSPTYGPDDVVTIDVQASQSFKAGDYVVALDDSQDIVAGNVYVMFDNAHFTDEAGDERPITARPVRPATPEEIAAHKAQSAPDNGAELAAAFTNTYERETVTIPKMTEEEATELWWSYRDRCDTTTSEDAIDMLRSLGIIRSATSIEAFEAHHGSGLSDEQMDAVRLYAEWSKSHDN